MSKSIRFMTLLMAVLMAVSVVFFMYGCKPETNNPDTDGTENTTTADTTTADDTAPESTPAASDVAQSELAPKYYAARGFDADGNDVDLTMYYGSAFSEYGGYIEFNEDGTFEYSIGVTKGPSTGKYKFVSNNDIMLTFDSDKVASVAVTASVDGVASELTLQQSDHYIVFKIQE